MALGDDNGTVAMMTEAEEDGGSAMALMVEDGGSNDSGRWQWPSTATLMEAARLCWEMATAKWQ